MLTVLQNLVLLLVYLRSAFAVTSQCTVTDVKVILEGCDHLSGLNLTSVGGTMVNDHNCDALLPKQVFIEEPLFQYPLADSKKFYTLILVDPDAPPQVEGEFYLHMIKSNIPGLSLKSKDSSKTVGIDYRGYKPPTPPRGTGPHRYISLLYEQADGKNFLPTAPSSRSRFVLANWLRGKNLCGPVAGNLTILVDSGNWLKIEENEVLEEMASWAKSKDAFPDEIMDVSDSNRYI